MMLTASHDCPLGLHDDNHRIRFPGYFHVDTAMPPDPLESLALHVY